MKMNEDEIPVKVVDRRWWARGEDDPAQADQRSLKPTYVEELERKVEERDKQVQEYLSKYRQASQEFEAAVPGKRTSAASEPRERSGDRGVPAGERVRGSGGAKPPGL